MLPDSIFYLLYTAIYLNISCGGTQINGIFHLSKNNGLFILTALFSQLVVAPIDLLKHTCSISFANILLTSTQPALNSHRQSNYKRYFSYTDVYAFYTNIPLYTKK